MTDTTAQPAGGTARIPGSKSITNRALLLAAAARGTSRLRFPLVSTDTVAFRTALADLGFRVVVADHDEVWEVTGAGRGPTGRTGVWCEDAGTAARFLPPFAAVGHGRFVFDGSAQLRARPLRPLAGTLAALGATVTTGPSGGLPMITVHPGTPTGARIACRRDHRIGMAFSVLGLRVPGITLDDPSCVGKTFPGFHEELRRLFPAASQPTSPQRQGSR